MGILEEEERRQNAEREAGQASARRQLAEQQAAEQEAERQRMTWTPEGRELADDFLRRARELSVAPTETVYTVTVKQTSGYADKEVDRVPFASAYALHRNQYTYLICAETGALLEKAPVDVVSDERAREGSWFRGHIPRTQVVVRSWRRVPLTNIEVSDSTDYDGFTHSGHTLVQVMAEFLQSNS